MSVRTAVIIAGGRGLRLGPYTQNLPKPMIRLLGKPLLQWVVEWLVKERIGKIVIGVAYKKESVMNYFRDGKEFGIEIIYSNHKIESDTGGAFKLAMRNGGVNDKFFLAMNGDELTNVSLENFSTFHRQNGGIATILAAPLRSNFGVINLNSHNVVTSFDEKPIIDSKFVSAGVYMFSREIYDYLPEKGSIERETFVRLAEERKLRAFRYFGFWRTVNTIKDIEIAEKELHSVWG